MSERWDYARAYGIVADILTDDPELLSAVVAGIAAGHAKSLTRLKEQLAWSNMAMDAALMLSTKRATPEAKKLLERCIVKRIELFGGGLNGAEKDFLASLEVRQ